MLKTTGTKPRKPSGMLYSTYIYKYMYIYVFISRMIASENRNGSFAFLIARTPMHTARLAYIEQGILVFSSWLWWLLNPNPK